MVVLVMVSGLMFLVVGAVIGWAGATIGLSRASRISRRLSRKLDREIEDFFRSVS